MRWARQSVVAVARQLTARGHHEWTADDLLEELNASNRQFIESYPDPKMIVSGALQTNCVNSPPDKTDRSREKIFFRVRRGVYTFYNPEKHGGFGDDGKPISAVSPLNAGDGGEAVAREELLEEVTKESLHVLGLTLVAQQLSMPGGRLDLLCKDEHGDYVVVELKRGRPGEEVTAQTLRYIKEVRERYCQGPQQVKGLIVCQNVDRDLMSQVSQYPELSVKLLKLRFKDPE